MAKSVDLKVTKNFDTFTVELNGEKHHIPDDAAVAKKITQLILFRLRTTEEDLQNRAKRLGVTLPQIGKSSDDEER